MSAEALTESGSVARPLETVFEDLDRCQRSRKERQMVSSGRTSFTHDEARQAGSAIGIDWASAPFDLEQFRMGMNVELEHGLRDPATDVTGSDPILTAKIALAHLNEFPDYYTRLARMEEEATQPTLTN
jgi:hypothetical protein